MESDLINQKRLFQYEGYYRIENQEMQLQILPKLTS